MTQRDEVNESQIPRLLAYGANDVEVVHEHMLHDARMYASWLGDAAAASKSEALTVDALRAESGAYRVLTPAQAVEYVREFGMLALHPLCGGCPPEDAWTSLDLVADVVLPALG